jgi:proteic killer suppression protein
LTLYDAALYGAAVIRGFRHKGLAAFYATGSHKGIDPSHATRLRLQLTALDHARRPRDMDAPGWRLHSLRGDLKGFHAVWVNANRRLVFRFENDDAVDVDYLDYH